MYYYRPCKKTPRIRIEGKFGTEKFKLNYRKAVKKYDSGIPSQLNKENPRTLKWLISRFKQSAKWELVAASTRKQWDSFFNQMITKSGNCPFAAIKRSDIIAGMDRRRKTPAAANNFLKTNKALFSWAKDADYIKADPAKDIPKLRYKSDGHLPWDEKEIIDFRTFWPVGTRERVAMELIYDTGLRRGDAVRLGKQHMKDGEGKLKTEKTGAEVHISFSEYFMFVLEHSPTGDMAYIATVQGAPRNKEAFGNWFRNACRQAGVKKSAHGLRKSAATEYADAGCTTKELMATFGWGTAGMAEEYTKTANRKRAQKRARDKRKLIENSDVVPPHHLHVGGMAKK